MLKYDGIKEREFCVTSVNGPITHASKCVMAKLERISELKRREAKSSSNFFNVNTYNQTARKAELNRSNSTSLAKPSLSESTKKSPAKRSLFPIYF